MSTLAMLPSARARADVQVSLAITGSTHLTHYADNRIVGRQLRTKAHRAYRRDRGRRTTVNREAAPGAYSGLPAWTHRDQWVTLVDRAIDWFPAEIRRKVSRATLRKFAARLAAYGDDTTGRSCRPWYSSLAAELAASDETIRQCFRALERLGLAVQVEASVVFSYNERMRIWRLERSKQRGLAPEYALVSPAAFVRALETGEHPGDLLAAQYAGTEDTAEPTTPAQKLSGALRALRTASPAPVLPEPAKQPENVADTAVTTAGVAAVAATVPESADGHPQAPVENRRRTHSVALKNVDILALPRSGRAMPFTACIALVSHVPHGVKSTASRAHNRSGGVESTGPGGTALRNASSKRRKRSGAWFGPHRDIAVHLTHRVLWLRGVRPGRIAMQLRRFTEPGLPKVWRPEDFVSAFDAINRRQGRYSPGANMASATKEDQAHAQRATSGAVQSPAGLLKWYLQQLDPANDHPRFELDAVNEAIAESVAARRAVAAREAAEATQLHESGSLGTWRAARRALTNAVHGGGNETTPHA